MRDGVGGDVRSSHHKSVEEFDNASVEDLMPVNEEITVMKTEVIEECCDYETLDGAELEDVKPFSTSECFQSATNEYPVTTYEQVLKNDHYEQHIVWCKEGNDFGLSEDDAAAKDDEKYVCDKCTYFTKYKSDFQRHILIHDGEKPFKCKTCGYSFKQKDDLKNHARIHDDELQRDVQCPHCNKAYYTNVSLQRHIDAKHSYKKYSCEVCDYTTNYKRLLRRHELVKHSSGDKLYNCMYCEHSTHYKKFIENHEPTDSNATLHKSDYNNFMSEQQGVSKKATSCDCQPCQFQTSYKESMKRHILATHGTKVKRHTCTICTYSTHIESYLRYHMRIHGDKESPKKYKCQYCNHTTRRKWNLDQHTLIHTNTEIFKCTYINCKSDCDEEKPCDCEVCDYQTVRRSTLKRHILRKHSGKAKVHTCKYCNYSTHVKGYLEAHLLRKHAIVKSIPSESS